MRRSSIPWTGINQSKLQNHNRTTERHKRGWCGGNVLNIRERHLRMSTIVSHRFAVFTYVSQITRKKFEIGPNRNTVFIIRCSDGRLPRNSPDIADVFPGRWQATAAVRLFALNGSLRHNNIDEFIAILPGTETRNIFLRTEDITSVKYIFVSMYRKFLVFTAATMNIVFWDVTLCSLANLYQHFGEPAELNCYSLKIEVAGSSET